jgi:aerobic carbon-monoxide dehydrogenase medium subunit
VKPAPFDYAAPATVDEALGLLGDDATILAGGQSLVPMLNFRLARPELIVDINGVRELDVLEREPGGLRIGALARQAALERSPLVASDWPLLARAVRHVGHAQTRSRGTVCGSAAHADPAAELPAALAALDARFELASRRGRRTLSARELFLGPLFTARAEDELLEAIVVPPPPPGARTAFVEQARTHGDFALAGAAVVIAPGHAAIAVFGVGSLPHRIDAAERALLAGRPREAAELAGSQLEDRYRRALVTELVRRAIEEASA